MIKYLMIVTEKPDQIKVIVCEDIMLHDGLYEQIINKEIDNELSATDKLTQTSGIDSAEAAKTLSEYISEVVLRGLENIKDNGEIYTLDILPYSYQQEILDKLEAERAVRKLLSPFQYFGVTDSIDLDRLK